jgi:hypothetical protein
MLFVKYVSYEGVVMVVSSNKSLVEMQIIKTTVTFLLQHLWYRLVKQMSWGI